MTQIINANDISTAVNIIKTGDIIAVPTDTVYGLICDAQNISAVKQIYIIKGRPENKPLILFVNSIKMAKQLSYFNSDAIKLAKAFWPGALTIIVNKKQLVNDSVTCNQQTVGLRMANNLIVNTIIKKCKVPLASTSANLSGNPSLTTATEVQSNLKGKLKLIVDGGKCNIGTPSTIISIINDEIKLLRQGSITKQQIQNVIGKPVLG